MSCRGLLETMSWCSCSVSSDTFPHHSCQASLVVYCGTPPSCCVGPPFCGEQHPKPPKKSWSTAKKGISLRFLGNKRAQSRCNFPNGDFHFFVVVVEKNSYIFTISWKRPYDHLWMANSGIVCGLTQVQIRSWALGIIFAFDFESMIIAP